MAAYLHITYPGPNVNIHEVSRSMQIGLTLFHPFSHSKVMEQV